MSSLPLFKFQSHDVLCKENRNLKQRFCNPTTTAIHNGRNGLDPLLNLRYTTGIYEHIFSYSTMMARSASPDREALDEHIAAQTAELFRALSDTSRVRIISALLSGEMNVGSLAEVVGISESAVSHHMRGLRQMRLVRSRKEGRQVYYCLHDEHIIDLFNRGLDHVLHG